jgi:predicted GTPase
LYVMSATGLSFVALCRLRPADKWICVADPLRQGHEVDYYPGDVNFRCADYVIVNKASPGVMVRSHSIAAVTAGVVLFVVGSTT